MGRNKGALSPMLGPLCVEKQESPMCSAEPMCGGDTGEPCVPCSACDFGSMSRFQSILTRQVSTLSELYPGPGVRAF